MVLMDSFFVFGGGRWRALDAASGRVEGWGRARFAIARAGQLRAARARPVLAALRALAASPAAAAAGAGPPLPYRFNEEIEMRGEGGCKHCRCCRHSRTRTTEKKASVAIQCGADIPTAPSVRLADVPRHSKRKRDSTSSADLSARAVRTVASVQPPAKRRRRPSSADSDRRRRGPRAGPGNGALASVKRKRISTSSERSLAPKLRKPGPLNGKRSERESSALKSIKVSSEIRRENKISKYLRPKPKKARKESSESVLRTARHNVSLVISSDDSDFESDRRRPKSSSTKITDSRREMGPKRVAEESPSEKQIKYKSQNTSRQVVLNNVDTKEISSSIKHKTGPTRAIEEAKELNGDSSTSYLLSSTRKARFERDKSKAGEESSATESRKYQGTPKELVIEERDVEILRLFLQKHYPDEALRKFDTNDDYKKLHFYQINPLVNVERCPQIARMLRGHSQDSQLSLVDFANKLGLRSITDASEPRRYRTRRRDKNTVIAGHATDSSVDKDKENFNRPTRGRNVKTETVLKETLNKGPRPNKDVSRIMEILEVSSDDSEHKRNNVVEPPLKMPKPKPTISTKRALFKEYSRLEDHAIVAWVSTGGRASQVNGNRLWRELQPQYQRITGHSRTWHSLRNRYLRYILPRLGELALPLAHQSRLRAAAATGELKARRREPRRNSMFAPPQRGAASRRPRPPAPSPEGGAHDTGRRAPRAAPPPAPSYSDVTRRFARTHRHHSSDSSLTLAHTARGAAESARPTNEKPAGARPSRTRSKSASVSSRRRTRQASPSVSSERKALSDSNRRKTRQKSPRESSERATPSVPNRRRTRQASPSESSERRSPNVSNRRKTRQKSPSVSNGRRSKSSESNSDSSESSEAERLMRNRRRSRRTRDSDTSTDASSDSDAPLSPPRRRSARRRSPGELSTPTSAAHVTHQSTAKSDHKSNRRQSRHESPSESSAEARHEPTESNRRKSNRRRSPIESNARQSPTDDRKSPERSKRLSLRGTAKRKSALASPGSDDDAQRMLRNRSPVKRTRKLFNPKALW